jgi:phosphatidylserine/phosphatidylglycerophosphate/cardiolipin synthase-like enzyme
MATIDELIAKYFVPNLLINKGSKVDFLVDGEEYFGAIGEEIGGFLKQTEAQNQAAGSFFYLAGWLFGLVQGPDTIAAKGIASAWTGYAGLANVQPFKIVVPLPGPGGTIVKTEVAMVDQIANMAGKGVSVRSFSFVHPLLFSGESAAKAGGGIWSVNAHSLLSTNDLRNRPELQAEDRYKKLILNTLNHPLGSMHLKMCLSGDKDHIRVYLAGLDLVSSRQGDWHHQPGPVGSRLQFNTWHDAGVRLQGPAAGLVYRLYRSLYNGQVDASHKPVDFQLGGNHIPSHYRDTPQLEERDLPAPLPTGDRAVQVLPTIPRMNFSLESQQRLHLPAPKDIKLPILGPAIPPLLGDIPIISPLLDLLYQCVMRLVMSFHKWHKFDPDGYFGFAAGIQKAVSEAENYIYIEDQSFTSFDEMQWINQRMKQRPNLKVILMHGYDPADDKSGLMNEAINRYLLDGIPDPSSRVSIWECSQYIIVHSKLTIIDDQWVAIGSANMMRRSLFMDGECSVGVTGPEATSPARELRVKLWGEHCGLAPANRNIPAIRNLAQAFGIFQPRFNKGLVTPLTGNTVVVGVDTNWTSGMSGMTLQVGGDPTHTYLIQSVDVDAQRLLLAIPYAGPNTGHVPYQIFDGRWPTAPAGAHLRGSAGSAMPPPIVGPFCVPLPVTNVVRPAQGTIKMSNGWKDVHLTGAVWAKDELKNRYIHVIDETGPRQTYKVVENDATSATLATRYLGPSASGLTYKLSEPNYANGGNQIAFVSLENGDTAAHLTSATAGQQWVPNQFANQFLYMVDDLAEARWMYRIKGNSADELTLFSPYQGPSKLDQPYRILPDIFLINTFGCYEPPERDQNDGDSRLAY